MPVAAFHPLARSPVPFVYFSRGVIFQYVSEMLHVVLYGFNLIRVERCGRFRLRDHAGALGLPVTMASSDNTAIVEYLRHRALSATPLVRPHKVRRVEPDASCSRGSPVAGHAVSTLPKSITLPQYQPADDKGVTILPPLQLGTLRQFPLAHCSDMKVPDSTGKATPSIPHYFVSSSPFTPFWPIDPSYVTPTSRAVY